MRHQRLQHRFVDQVPRALESGVLYISLEHGTAIHSCCCGCGEEVVTPLTPTDWRMTYDGETVSLHPSIDNWQLRCRSHYVIDRGRVIEAGSWRRKQVADEQARDKRAKVAHYASITDHVETAAPSPAPAAEERGFWAWLDRLALWAIVRLAVGANSSNPATERLRHQPVWSRRQPTLTPKARTPATSL